MSIVPPAAAGQDLYDVSDTPKAKPGTEFVFQTTNGPSWARYMQNSNGTSSMAAGFGVGWAGSGFGFNTANLNNASAEMQFFAGIAVGNYTTSAQYGWVVYRGPVTNIQLAATYTSSTAQRTLALDSLGRYATAVSTFATDNHLAAMRAHAILRATTATVTSALQSGAVADIYWR